MLKKIVVIGPESTGKSTLCRQLASHFNTEWVPEYARDYLLKNGTRYTYEDLLTIAKGQLQLEDRYVKGLRQKAENFTPNNNTASMLFIDTDMYVMKVWSEFVFGKCHSFILNEIVKREYGLYLLTKPDLPWAKDELREYPDLETREKLYKIYKDILINQPVPWVIIEGDYEQRLKLAVKAVVELC